MQRPLFESTVNILQLWRQNVHSEAAFCGQGVARAEIEVSSFPRLPPAAPGICTQSSGEKGERRVERSGGLQPWNVRALLILSIVARSRRHSARAARDRSGSARRRQDNAAGAGGMMAVSKNTEQVWYCKTGPWDEISVANTMKQVGGESLANLFALVRCRV